MKSLEETVLPHVPYMRRYATLLCLGDRDRGNRLVEKVLTEIVTGHPTLNEQIDHRLTLLGVMQKTMRTNADAVPGVVDHESFATSASEKAYSLLARMPIEQRSALLLLVVEKLSHVDAAKVIGTTAAIVRALAADARGYLDETATRHCRVAHERPTEAIVA